MAALVLGKLLDTPVGYVIAGLLAIGFLIAWYRGKEEGEEEFESQNLFEDVVPATEPAAIKEPVPIAPDTLPHYCPRVAPHGYGSQAGKNGFGLIVTNPGYPAFNVHIPPATVGFLYRIVFPARVAQLLERDHQCLFAASLEHPKLPGRPGEDLFDVMRANDIDKFNVAILYQDGDFRSYKSDCVIERDIWVAGGINVKFLGQHLVSKADVPVVNRPQSLKSRIVTICNEMQGFLKAHGPEPSVKKGIMEGDEDYLIRYRAVVTPWQDRFCKEYRLKFAASVSCIRNEMRHRSGFSELSLDDYISRAEGSTGDVEAIEQIREFFWNWASTLEDDI
jgi:hypothetical protein